MSVRFSRPTLCSRGTTLVGVLLLSTTCFPGIIARSAEPAVSEAQIAAHLAAGEFAPAIQLAGRETDPQRRDAWLHQIATAQVQGGARQASLATTAGIQDDNLRSSTYEAIARQPLGGARGGAAMADFDTLIELITSTVSPDSWDAVGGPGAIEPFPTGVLVDTSGLLKRISSAPSVEMDLIRDSARHYGENRDVRRPSTLRKVSLTRLEREAQRLWAVGKSPDESMRLLAGLRRVQFVLVYPEDRDIVLAGPAGDWRFDAESRPVGNVDGCPVLQLDDLVVVLRNTFSEQQGRFGCAITPRETNLASVQEFLRVSSQRPLKPGERGNWIKQLRERLGRQDISVYGIDPRSRDARTIVEADYHMKLIGMGLAEGTLGVKSYLDRVALDKDGAPPAMDVLRWWFTLNYDFIRTTDKRDAFELEGPGVKVQSENELLGERGKRIHTGASDELNQQFAHDFTAHFADLAIKYPVYAELRNLFDLALVAAVIRSEKLADRIDWQLPFFLDDGKYQIDFGVAPREVESIVNYRLLDRRHLVVGVSGGVAVDPAKWVETSALQVKDPADLQGDRAQSRPRDLGRDTWWWD